MGKTFKRYTPSLNLFDFDRYPPSVDNLDAGLTINGSTVYPNFRYNAKHAGSSIWKPWGYGKNLVLEGAGTAPSYNQGSPLMGKNDDSILFKGSGGAAPSGRSYLLSPSVSTTAGNLGLEDVCFEFISNLKFSTVCEIMKKKSPDGGGTLGWELYETAIPTIVFSMVGPTVPVSYTISSLQTGVFAHYMLFLNRDENSNNSLKLYVNGVVNSSNNNGYAMVNEDLTNAGKLVIGGWHDQSYCSNSTFSLISMYAKSSWFQAGAAGPTEWATIAAERFYKLTGVYPQQSRGTAMPTVCSRASSAYMDKYESNGTRKIYLVGSGWPRVCERQESSTSKRMKGFLSETAATNLLLRSSNLNAYWGKDDLTIPATSMIAPDGIANTTCVMHEDADDSDHFISQAIGAMSATYYSISFFAKAINRNWVQCVVESSPVAAMYFNLSNGATGWGTGGLWRTYTENYGNGWYKCVMIFSTAATVASSVYIGVASADTVGSFQGLDQDSIAVWGVQCEIGIYPTSYISTTSAAVTKVADVLQFNSNNMSANKGTISCDILYPSYTDDTERLLLDCSDGTNTNRISLSQTTDHLTVDFKSAGDNTTVNGSTDLVAGTIKNIKVMYDKTQLRATVNGISEISPTSKTAAPTITTIGVGNNYGSVNQTNTIISNVKINKEATNKK